MSLGSGSGKNGGGNGFGEEIRFRFGNVTMWGPEDSGGSASEEGAVGLACCVEPSEADLPCSVRLGRGPKKGAGEGWLGNGEPREPQHLGLQIRDVSKGC